MEKEPIASPISDLSAQDWHHSALSVQRFILSLLERLSTVELRLAALEEENRMLKERLGINSSNSSRPPSSDISTRERKKKKPTGRERGAQPGHPGHRRELLPVQECQKVVDHYPQRCRHCQGSLSGVDPQPLRHQVVEIPPLIPFVEEHRLHRLCCPQCRARTCAAWPEEVPRSGYGSRLVAVVAVLCGLYRLSERMTQEAISDLFGVEISLGSIDALRQEASLTIAAPVEEARTFVQQQEVVHADETGFVQGNADGANPDLRKAWLWVAATALVITFRIHLSRGADAAREVLGGAFLAVLVSDRWHAYNWVDLRQRQLCWAHLKREFQKIEERGGESRQLGEALLAEEKKLFTYFNRVRDGTLARSTFRVYAGAIRQRITVLLEKGAAYQIKRSDKSERARTARTCRELLKVEAAMWLFVRREGVEPTNNRAERAIRPAVLWRRTSFGAQSAGGSEFVARMLTVVMTLRAQQRNVLEYMTQACQAARRNTIAPSLLPQVSAPELHSY